jgi:lysophospholipase L1-like esterase
MSRATRLARAAAITLIAGTVGGAAVLSAEALAAKRRKYAQPHLGLAMRSAIGNPAAATLKLVLLGDSSALGVGVNRVEETVGGQLAALLAQGNRRVELSSVAVSGARARDLPTQVARALLGSRPDLAVILIGSNDATTLRRPQDAATELGNAVRRLREAGVAVVVGTCPDLGATRAFAPPLRQLAGAYGRKVAKAQIAAVARAGGMPVDLATKTGAVFRADPGTLCHDGFHPSADGYGVWADALFPAVAEAAGVPNGR